MQPASIVYFESAAAFGRWLDKHGAAKTELWVGFHRKGSGRRSLTWPESVDEALCRGWIDGIRKSVDDQRYTIRFTPRRRASIWSSVNIRRAKELVASGRMRPSGLAAFRGRREDRTRTYSYEQVGGPKLFPAQERRLRENAKAWAFFRTRSDAYRRTASWWVVSARREETRNRRLCVLISCSAAGRPIPPLPRAPKKRGSVT